MDEKAIAQAVLLLVRDKNLSKKFVFMNIMSKQGFDDFISGNTRISFFLLYQLLERMNVSLSEFDEILTYCRLVFMLVQAPLVACLNKFSTRVLSRICTFSKMLTVICPSTN